MLCEFSGLQNFTLNKLNLPVSHLRVELVLAVYGAGERSQHAKATTI